MILDDYDGEDDEYKAMDWGLDLLSEAHEFTVEYDGPKGYILTRQGTYNNKEPGDGYTDEDLTFIIFKNPLKHNEWICNRFGREKYRSRSKFGVEPVEIPEIRGKTKQEAVEKLKRAFFTEAI